MANDMIKLAPRMLAAAELCGAGRRIIDVGCDHAELAIYLRQRGAERVIASDVREGPLRMAAHNIEKYGVHGVELRLCDGLSGFSEADCDTVAICGMGGELIASILEAAPWTAEGGVRLVLQPMSRSEHLRIWLARHGYAIEEERLARDGGRLYSVLAARGGAQPRETHGLFSQSLTRDALFGEYAAALAARYRREAEGKRRAGLDISEEKRALAILKEYL